MEVDDDACRVCGSTTAAAGEVFGRFSGRTFRLRRCDACGFGFVADPWTDYAAIYSDAYYAGEGADPLVDYVYELEHPERTIRRHEWHGILRRVRSLGAGGSAGSTTAAARAGSSATCATRASTRSASSRAGASRGCRSAACRC